MTIKKKMTTTDAVTDSIPTIPMRWLRWTRGLLLYPRLTMQQIAKHKRPAWVLPMVLLAVLSGIAAWQASTIRVGDPQPALLTSATEQPIHGQAPLAPRAIKPWQAWIKAR